MKFIQLLNYLSEKIIFIIESLSCLLKSSSTISLLGLIISGLTLIVAWLAYAKYIKNKLREKQLDVVVELIEVLKDTNFSLHFYLSNTDGLSKSHELEISRYEDLAIKNGDKILGININIFELANLKNSSLFKNGNIFIDISLSLVEKQKIDSLIKLALNPIMPKTISLSLKKLRISDESFEVGLLKNNNKSSNFVRIGNGQEGELSDISGFCSDEDGVAFKSWKDFIRSCESIPKKIKRWMKTHGITEINL